MQYTKKENELHLVLKRLNEWGQTSSDSVEEANAILNLNQESFNQISQLDSELSVEERKDFLNSNKTTLTHLIVKQKELIIFIKNESDHLTEQLAQMNQKSNVVNHYMNKEKSLFIDKDM
ncbi:hypothetical protein ACO1PF_11175 [Alkalibacterium sp. f15]|uniref:hypothetical protein n=1 Tax=Alkalibacterium sp. f15 TaxID=3414029 RepID=UPI003BF846E1